MKIVCLNGNPLSDVFDEYLVRLNEALMRNGHAVEYFDLKKIKMPLCTGCFGCWVKTPGQCVSRDASRDISAAAIRSDMVIFASPLIMGFTSALLKNVNDKLIQILHPYIEFDQNELHHRRRYERYPRWGVVVKNSENSDEEDLSIMRTIYERDALNFKTDLAFFLTSDRPVSEVVDALAHC